MATPVVSRAVGSQFLPSFSSGGRFWSQFDAFPVARDHVRIGTVVASTCKGLGVDALTPALAASPQACAKSVLCYTDDSDHSDREEELLRALKERRTEDAWRLNEVLRREGKVASQVCLSRLVAQLAHQGTPSSLARAQKLLVELQKLDQVDLLDVDSLGLLVMSSARSGASRYALSILRLMLRIDKCPPVKVWSAVVSRLGKHPYDAHLGVQLFDDICTFLELEFPSDQSSGGDGKIQGRAQGTEATNCAGRSLAEGKGLNGKMVFNKGIARFRPFGPDTAAFNAVLNACATSGLVKQAENLVRRMACFGVEPDLLTFNILIKLFSRAKDRDEISHVLQRMAEVGIEPDLSTYNSLVSAHVHLGDVDKAEQLVQSMKFGQEHSRSKENARPRVNGVPIWETGEHKAPDVLHSQAQNLVRNETSEDLRPRSTHWVKPDVRTYTTLMKGYVKKGRLQDAARLLVAMQHQDDSDSHPNEVTYSTVIAACVDKGMMDAAKDVLLEMVAQNVPANLVTYNILLRGYCNAGQVSTAYEVMEDMRGAGISPDAVSYNTLINGCIQRDDNVGAFEVFKEMRKAKISPTEVSYTTLMNAFARNGQPNLVGEVFEEMHSREWMRLDVIAWNVLIDGYCKAGEMQSAKGSFERMKKEGFHPSVATYGSLVKGFSSAGQPGEVLVLWREIKERTEAEEGGDIEPLEPDGGLLDILVDTCLRAGYFQRAMEVVSCMEGQGILADKIKYKRMFIDLYSTLYTSKHASPQRRAKSAERRSAVDAFKFWLGLPNKYYQSDWTP